MKSQILEVQIYQNSDPMPTSCRTTNCGYTVVAGLSVSGHRLKIWLSCLQSVPVIYQAVVAKIMIDRTGCLTSLLKDQ